MTIGRIPSVEGGIQPTIFDAKADLLTATAADTPARLAVGTNDQVLVADSSTTTGLAWKSYGAQFVAGKNAIINGDFRINQRNFTSNTTNGSFNFDRWIQNQSGGTVTVTPQTFTPGAAPVAGYEGATYVRVATTGQSTTSHYTYLETRLEDVRLFAGQTVTLSFWAKASSGTPYLWMEYQQNFGSGGSSLVYAQAGSTQTISTSWARYSVTFAVPSISGKTIGTSSHLDMFIFTSLGSAIRGYSNATFQNATIDIWGVQLEAGSVATPFTTATGTLQGELAACQRYYYLVNSGSSRGLLGSAGNDGTTTINSVMPLPVTMRTAPTLVSTTGSGYYIYRSGGVEITTSSLLGMGEVSTRIAGVYQTGVTAGTSNAYGNLYTGNTSASIAWNSEL